MKLSRTDLVPVLAIVAGGVIGASLSFNFLALSPSADDVPALESVSAAHESVEVLRSIRLQEMKPYSMVVYTFEQIEAIRRFQEAQRLLEEDRMERIEEAMKSARHQLEEVQLAQERDQESLLRLREELQEE